LSAISAHESTTGADRNQTRFSIVSAAYNVAKFLPDFIAGIDTQTFPAERLEVIVVDDGSTDETTRLLHEWQQRRPGLVTVLSQPNAGQGSARNFGMEKARGEWITFTDPDDILEADYLQRVDEFLQKQPATSMIATNRIMFHEATGEITESHPLRWMFAKEDRAVDLHRFPHFFHGSAPAAFFRADVLKTNSLRFDDAIRPNFEDGHFCTSYLLLCEQPIVGFVQSARYIYRKRADSSSTLQNSVSHSGRYLVVPKRGYLDVLRRSAAATGGYPAEWVQSLILYELSYYFLAETAVSITAGTAAQGEVAAQFIESLREIRELLDPVVIESFALRRFDRVWRDILIHGLSGEPWVTPYAVVQNFDPVSRRLKLVYRYVGPAPREKLMSRGLEVQAEDGKVRDHVYFGRPLMYERIAWLPLNGTLRLELNGKPVDIRQEWPQPALTNVRPVKIERWFAAEEPKEDVEKRWSDLPIKALGRSLPVRQRYRHAWVLLDRLHDADDNGERLFEYLRRSRRDVNAWFVIEKDTPDFERLRKSAGKRVVAYGSLRWKLLMLNCQHLISSHADKPVHSPDEIVRLIEPKWRFSFLQHGVIKDDISRWLNPKRMDLFVTSTPQEHESIVGDHTPYAFTSHEVKMTGLPRFDRLLELGNQVPPSERKLILVCPTWRQWLAVPKERGSHRRVVTDDFFASEYAQRWLGFLRDDRLRELAAEHGLRIGFLPHPNIQPALPDLQLPPHVEALSFVGNDSQRLFASAALMVTDYSSMAFNAAYLDRPVVYFQFDADLVLGGGHTGRQGYYDYERDGFGPVARTEQETVAAVEALIRDDGSVRAEYQRRVAATFPDRDGQCCARTADAIASMTRPRGSTRSSAAARK